MTASDNSTPLSPTYDVIPSNEIDTELEVIYRRRAASLQQQREVGKAMQEALLRAQENQQFYLQAQKEYNEIDEIIDADTERILEISGKDEEGFDISTVPQLGIIGAILEGAVTGQRHFPQEEDLDSDLSSLSPHHVNSSP